MARCSSRARAEVLGHLLTAASLGYPVPLARDLVPSAGFRVSRVSLKHVSGGSSHLQPDYISRVNLEAARWGQGTAVSPQVR